MNLWEPFKAMIFFQAAELFEKISLWSLLPYVGPALSACTSASSSLSLSFACCFVEPLSYLYFVYRLCLGSQQEQCTAVLLVFPFYSGQFAMAVRVPLLVIAYVVVPKEETSFTIFMFLALFVGLSSMAGVAVNRPILADVVRPNHKATVFALVSTEVCTKRSQDALFICIHIHINF